MVATRNLTGELIWSIISVVTEITAQSVLTESEQLFVLHWGEMGSRWGINRTMAQIHALLLLSPDPLDAETISDTLHVARSNVSTSLRELQRWDLVRPTPVLGQRRDHFTTEKNPWALFRLILRERKRREIDPTIAHLRRCLDDTDATTPAREELTEMLRVLELADSSWQQLDRLAPRTWTRLLELSGRIPRLLGLDQARDPREPHREDPP